MLKAWSTKTTIEEIFNDIKYALDAINSNISETGETAEDQNVESVKDEL